MISIISDEANFILKMIWMKKNGIFINMIEAKIKEFFSLLLSSR